MDKNVEYNLERPAVHAGKADVAAMQDQIH